MKYIIECSQKQAEAFAPFFAKRGIELTTEDGKAVLVKEKKEIKEKAPKKKKRTGLLSSK
jgi:hypothetical protein